METAVAFVAIVSVICVTIILIYLISSMLNKPKKIIKTKINVSKKTDFDNCNIIVYTDNSLDIEYYNNIYNEDLSDY